MGSAGPRRWDVSVDLPCEPPFARVARTTAASCATLQDLSQDAVDDLRLLVDEVFVAMSDRGAARVALRCTSRPGGLRFEMVADAALAPGSTGAAEDLAAMIAGVVARDVVDELDQPRPRFAATILAC